MSKNVFPTIGILPRLKLKIIQQLKEYNNIEELSVEKMVDIAIELPNFAIIELWGNFHQGTNLDNLRVEWLKTMINIHGYNHLEFQALRLYWRLKEIIENASE